MAKKLLKKKDKLPKIFGNSTVVRNTTISLVSILLVVVGVYLFFKNYSYFKVDKLIFVGDKLAIGEEDKVELLNLYTGRNIFEIDINTLSTYIKRKFPIVNRAIVRRVMPNRLEISIVSRKPIAFLDRWTGFAIDKDGVVLFCEMDKSDLPHITGLSFWLKPEVGKVLHSKQIEAVLEFLTALREAGLQYMEISRIDVSNYKNISFYLNDGIEVKIGGEDFVDRLRRLERALKRDIFDRGDIKYIDLRFKDVVIGPK